MNYHYIALKKGKIIHIRDACWHDKVSHHAMDSIFTGWASLVSTELCRRACMHVCHLTCALLCLSRDWCLDVCVVSARVCVQCSYIHGAGNQRAPNWIMAHVTFLT